ncbi:MAG TPA: NADH-quinone oxidoreductase subunit NuoE [Bacillota bacterium]|nr:NADH-quinone oxidoreductase subunit NuoE [Bacillota bacterium]HPZ64507.1 NADH-quinone oxidoreductase subunit NuoE [Bacillota bacterium]HQD06413.1 NADH-quinone oxidoreductase subunit NuoE [Bacillota bacterium]
MEERLKSIFAAFQGEKNELISLLQEVQEEFGYLPVEAMQEVARFLRLPESKVFGVATFYARFHLEPRGRHILRQCCGTACHVRGAQRIADKIMDVLKVEAGRTTKDLQFTYEQVACIGACGLAPVMTIDETTYGKLTPDKTQEILESYVREGEGGSA